MLNQILARNDPHELAAYIATRYSVIVAVDHAAKLLAWEKNGITVKNIACDRFNNTDCNACLWLNTRLRELGYFTPGPGEISVPDGLVTAVLHFWPWDEERFGPKPQYKPGEFTPARSKIFDDGSRKPTPIDRTAFNVAAP